MVSALNGDHAHPRDVEAPAAPGPTLPSPSTRAIISGRAQHHGLARKARIRARQPLQLAARLQLIETRDVDHLLTHLVAVTAALDDLQISKPNRGFAASAAWSNSSSTMSL
jgi:hypothetical protein